MVNKWYIPDMEQSLTFGEWLGDELHRRGWKVTWFAGHVDVGRTTVSGWLHDHFPPKPRNCRRIAHALEVDENEVLVRAGYPPKDLGYVLPEQRPAAVEDERSRYDYLADNEDLVSEMAQIVQRMLRIEEELERRRREREDE